MGINKVSWRNLTAMFAALLLCACATKPADFAAEANIELGQKFIVQVKEDDGSITELECVRKKALGSNMIRKKCLPLGESDRLNRRSQQQLRNMKRSGQGQIGKVR